MQNFIVIAVVSGVLVVGALWGLYGALSEDVEGFIVALAGGALILSAVLELIEPSVKQSSTVATMMAVFSGALLFSGLDYLVKTRMNADTGGGLLAAITFDGVPENLALGVGLIGAGPLQVAALSASIFLSNLPEAAAGAKEMRTNGINTLHIVGLWGAAALLLAAAALLGNWLLVGVPEFILAMIRSFAAGAVIASLAVEVFPTAFRKERYSSGAATALGLILALYLNALA